MTEVRQTTLNNAATFFGLEAPQTIEIFTMSERLPEEQFDDAIRIVYLARVDEYECEQMFYDDDEEPDWDSDMGFDPYMGCYTGDC